MNNTSQNIQQAHRANIIKNIERRLEAARKTNQTLLIEQLEAEKRYFSH